MRSLTKMTVLSAIAGFGVGAAVAQPVLTVNGSQRFQTIEGFGASASWWWNPMVQNNFRSPAFADRLVNDLGISIVRLHISAQFQPNEDPNPFSLNLQADGFNTAALEPDIILAKNMQALRSDVKAIALPWSPPAWMKTNNSLTGGGNLRADRYDHFAKYLSAYVLAAQSEYGVRIDAVGPQNEPRFAQPFESCVYEPEMFRDVLVSIDQAFTRFNVPSTTRIFGPSNHGFLWNWTTSYVNAAASNPVSRNRLNIISLHGYATPNDGTDYSSVATWQAFTSQFASLNKPVWLTEEAEMAQNWLGEDHRGGKGAIQMARLIHDAMVGGNASAWIFWAVQGDIPTTNGALLLNDTATPPYYALQHYARYVRPGHVRVGTSGLPPTFLSTAFIDPDRRYVAIVLINRVDTREDVTIRLTNLPGPVTQLQNVRSSLTEGGANQLGAVNFVNGQATITLPQYSITTLYGTWNLAPVMNNAERFLQRTR